MEEVDWVRSGGFSPWLIDGCLLPVSVQGLPSVCVSVPVPSAYGDAGRLD